MNMFTIHQASASKEALDRLNTVGWDGDFGEYDAECRLERDVLFHGGSEKFTSDMSEFYNLVGTVEAEDLNKVFVIGNMMPQKINLTAGTMRSISVGDIIEDLSTGTAYMVDRHGFSEVDFQEVA